MEASYDSETVEVKAYPRRYLMLFLSAFTSGLIMFQAYEYTSIAKAVSDYYQVSYVMVTFTSIAGNIAYAAFFFVGVHYLQKNGIRFCLIVGSAVSALGACFKCFSVQRDAFYILIFGQILPAIGQTLTAPLPPLLAAVWFKNNETATVIGVYYAFCTLGNACCAVLNLLFPYGQTECEIEASFQFIAILTAVLCTLCFILVIIFIESKPPNPPSHSQMYREEIFENTSLKILFKNKNYLLLASSFVINSTVSMTLSIIFNQMVFTVFPNGHNIVTIGGLLMTLSGLVGALFIPYLLDRTKKFQLISITCFAASLFFLMLMLHSSLLKSVAYFEISTFLFGLFLVGFTSIAVDIVVDITYPFPEGTSIGFLYFFSAIPTIIITPMSSSLMENFDISYAFAILGSLLLIGTIFLFCGHWELKRKQIEEEKPLLKF
ncbi:putative MFS-type transporter C09D4.1-like protein [Dinothrombium tinctorium]|uniref:Putative MFS-type transporter C09D4.1-like protein n=1 Tax=Dinothrombium tinctorium TaxID=1965070 RepID=A0A443QHE5_9ACAR|nr:putative MFS-type transporter C09D4.1-like protein [Dinothrombium tinctorium]